MSRENSKSGISDDDRTLFREDVGQVKPLYKGAQRPPDHQLPSARPRSRQADEQAVVAALLDDAPDGADTGDELVYARPGLQHRVVSRLRRGHYRCQAELDLHGLFVATARPAVAQFLIDSHDAGYRCVRIITGKGLRSGNDGPVLRSRVGAWLRRRDEVLAYCSARRVDGGTGAFYVLLRRS